MRTNTLLTSMLACFLLFAGCKKSDIDNLPTNYRIDGIQDITMQQTSSNPILAYMSISVTQTGKIQEHVSLSLEGLPAGCGATINGGSGYPSFSTTIIIRDSSADGGTYPVKLVCDGSVTGKKSYSFNLTLPEFPDCAGWLLRSYLAGNSCGGSYNEFITAGNTKNKIVFNNFENAGVVLQANVTCQTSGSSSISLPSQTVNGITYSGYGSAAPSYFYISYTKYIPGSGTTYCTLNLN